MELRSGVRTDGFSHPADAELSVLKYRGIVTDDRDRVQWLGPWRDREEEAARDAARGRFEVEAALRHIACSLSRLLAQGA